VRRYISAAVFLVCVVLSVAGMINVFADNADVIRMANEVACGDQGATCRAQMTRMERTPFSQTFEIVTPKRTVDVRCRRGAIFFGGYACALP
jgi:hypothetical protein